MIKELGHQYMRFWFKESVKKNYVDKHTKEVLELSKILKHLLGKYKNKIVLLVKHGSTDAKIYTFS